MWTISKAADFAGVSVRTLHYYDEIGLLSPSKRTEAGYRVYTRGDLLHLAQIGFFKKMGFPLERIAELLGAPDFDRVEALSMQQRYLAERIEALNRQMDAIERAIAHEKGTTMEFTDENVKEVFGEFDPREYEAEVEERWGGTDAYKESQRRAATYNKDDWARIQAEGQANNERLAALFAEDRPADDAEVQAAVHEHWRQINDNFYPCSMDIYVGLADMYVADPRFKATYDAIQPGFAEKLSEAMHVYAVNRA